MTSSPKPVRRRGAPAGNTNRLVHGRYRRSTRVRASRLREWVGHCRVVCADLAGIDALWRDLTQRQMPRSKRQEIEVRIAIEVFKCLRQGLKTAAALGLGEIEALGEATQPGAVEAATQRPAASTAEAAA